MHLNRDCIFWNNSLNNFNYNSPIGNIKTVCKFRLTASNIRMPPKSRQQSVAKCVRK